MTTLILHHYPSSPFSEKIRAVLGYKQLAWKSVVIPAIMPKPDVIALTGGYRKTPFMQVGADIYCDSALICDMLEHVRAEPTLYPPHLKGVSRIFAQWADTTLFWAAMAYNLQPKGAAQVFAKAPPEAAKAFAEDRKAMTGGMTRLRPADATSAYRSYLRRIAHMVEEHDFLFGAEPCIADFAAYHSLWYTRVQTPVMADILAATPAVSEWMDRMAAIGHGAMEKFSAADAITIAHGAEPMPAGQNLLIDSAFQDDHGIALGSEVTVAAETFGPEATQGTLMAATRTHFTLRREDPRAGLVHVHFPRVGYVMRKVEAAA
ncbi:glutathione S-transferase family protein [Caenimonas koreensis DSM 17982]|uniref:Glutathione S-transferase family protein n=1 Tax=Caenimonas koreensis DSM 17982 TaxID=1121255 RepID=A0A844B5T5_9BURK|nr:glutathione S-transferase family protein [Caenimonas koreensis]MRD48552.1 glutathione S-transferase family protein [Caenimonas koreensis DSM 17982]